MNDNGQREERIQQGSQNLTSARTTSVVSNILFTIRIPTARPDPGERHIGSSPSFFIAPPSPQSAYLQARTEEVSKNFENLLNAIRSKNSVAIKATLIASTRNYRTDEAQKQAINLFNSAWHLLKLTGEQAKQLWEKVDYPHIEETVGIEDDASSQNSTPVREN